MAKKNINENIKVGVIGMGRFGSLVFSLISKKFTDVDVVAFDIGFDCNEVGTCDVVILAVPISTFEEVVREISSFLKPKTLVIDVCGVKMHPSRVMVECLPNEVDIVATHPMFGPDSVRAGLKGLKVVLWKIRDNSNRFNVLKKACKDLGLEVIEMSPKEHDMFVAFSQTFTHLVGRLMEESEIISTPIDTLAFKKLLEVKSLVVNDKFDLFLDMNRFNPFAKEVRLETKRALSRLEEKI